MSDAEMASGVVRLEDLGAGVLRLRIHRPESLNALNSIVLSEILQTLRLVETMQGARVLILTGSGTKAFVAGADISEMAGLSRDQAHSFAKRGHDVMMAIERLSIPVIAAVNGFALGGGCELAIACDFIVASSSAVFGQPEVGLGLMTGFGGAVRLARFVGWPRAKELLFSGRRINADEALRIGLVNSVCAPEELDATAMRVAKEIGAKSRPAVAALKRLLGRFQEAGKTAEFMSEEARGFAELFETSDQKEGTRAFLEKRKPQFEGVT